MLIAAPTGSGKTLAAFLAAIDALVRQGIEAGLPDETQIVYVSPLKALSNDIRKNLEAPLAGIREALRARGLPEVAIRSWVRTGDTPPAERDRMRRLPPHILVTTPESLYILLGSESGRRMLAPREDRHRRRDPRGRAEQARLASRAVAGAARRAVRQAVAAHRPVGDAEADRAGRPLSGRRRRPRGPARRSETGMHDHRHRPSPARATSRSNCRPRRSKRSCRARSGRRSTTASPS